MMKISNLYSLGIGILFCVLWSGAKALELPAFFSDGMVLQQQTKVSIWGKSKNRQVSLNTSWDGGNYQAEVDTEGNWKIEVTTVQAGGSFVIRISDESKTITIKDVLLGEVWLASGQSNMEMSFKGFTNQPVNNSKEVVRSSANNQIRFFKVGNKSWGTQLNDVDGEWLAASPNTTEDFSAVAYYFAKTINRELSVPVAIIQSDWGGTPIQAWMSRESLQKFSNRVNIKDIGDKAHANKNEPTGLYNAMIHPLLNYVIKGMIWYQGEANRLEPLFYQSLFPAMVADWRKSWGQTDFPFYYAQIASYSGLDPQNFTPRAQRAENFTPYLRDAQRVSAETIPNSGMAVLMDVGSASTIHPPDKETVGNRLSALALHNTYGKQQVACYGPVYKSKRINCNTIVLSFDHAEGLYISDNQLPNFEIAGSDKVFYPAEAIVKGNEIVVKSPKVPKPTEARYAFKAWAIGTLFNKDNLPASSFRTDNYTASEVGQP